MQNSYINLSHPRNLYRQAEATSDRLKEDPQCRHRLMKPQHSATKLILNSN